jgi:putative ABC transport system permease protein
MLKNYLTVAIRNLMRHKAYTFINMIGLAIGLTCSTLIMLYLQHEFSYDRHHSKADRIHRVFPAHREPNGDMSYHYAVPGPVAPALAEDFPEVERATRFMSRGVQVGVEGKESLRGRVTVADREFFRIFDFPLVQGDAQTGLQTPFSIFVTQSFAQKLFGDADPTGKTIQLDSKLFGDIYTVSGILKDPPETSTFDLAPDMVTATHPLKSTYKEKVWELWKDGFTITYTYIQLQPNALGSVLEKKLPNFIEQHLGKDVAQHTHYKLMPLTRLHLYGRQYGIARTDGDINTCYTLGLIGIVIVVVACINFMNLSTARSARRMREVGMRKVVGAKRTQLVYQFLCESVLLSILSLILSLSLTPLALPMLSGFMQMHLSLNAVAVLVLVVLAVGILAGSYPAFFLSSFRPITALKSMRNTKGEHASVRKGLVVVQFAISCVLIIGTLVVFQQMEYMRTANLGFNKDALITTSQLTRNAVPMKSQFQQLAGVQNATITQLTLFDDSLGKWELKSDGMNTPIKIDYLLTDPEFLDTHEIPLLSGRQFALQDFASTSLTSWHAVGADRNILLNETAAQHLNVHVGDLVDDMSDNMSYNTMPLKVVGIFKDFHHQSLHHTIRPLMLYPIIKKNQSHITVRVAMQNLPEVLARLEKTWKTFEPDRPFEFRFVDDARDQAYHRELRLSRIYAWSSGLAIAIACLGLLGLIAYTAEVRTKEIGIRKVLGATETSIVSLLTKEFLVLVVLASLFAYPVAYYTMNSWLQNFAYRIGLSFVYFIASTGATLIITLITIAYQALKAARTNPIEALRYE